MDLESMTVETDPSDHREVKPHFINPYCFEEDFARWLKGEVGDLAAAGLELSEPIQEALARVRTRIHSSGPGAPRRRGLTCTSLGAMSR